MRQKNENEREKEADFLSDSVYHYDSDDHIFEKATTFETKAFIDFCEAMSAFVYYMETVTVR